MLVCNRRTTNVVWWWYRVATFQTTWNSLTFPVAWTGRLSIYCIALEQSLFHVNYNKHSNQLTKSYKSVNDEHIQSPNWFNCIIDSCHWYVDCTLKQISVSLTFSIFPDFSLITLEFPDFPGFPGEWPPCWWWLWLFVQIQIHCPEKRDQNVLCNVSYKTWERLMKFGTPFPE